jgi:drug/metabolite transporter (DMT)-like permease
LQLGEASFGIARLALVILVGVSGLIASCHFQDSGVSGAHMFRSTWFAFLTVIAAWGSSYLFIRLAVESFTPTGLVATRFGLAAIICFGISKWRNEKFPSTRVTLRYALSGILMMSGSNSLTAYAQGYVASGVTGVVHSLGSVWLAALGSLGVFGANIPRTPARAWFGVVLGVVGVAVLLWPTSHMAQTQSFGIVILLLATFLFAAASVIQRRTQQKEPVGLFAQLAIQMAGGSTVGLLLSTHFGILHHPLTRSSLGAITVLTLFASVAGFAAFSTVLKNWPPARAGSFGVVNPVVAVLLGVWILDEQVTTRTLVGASLALIAVAWVQFAMIQTKEADRR